MLKKMKLRALSPGQWARVRVPGYELWQQTNGDGFCRTRPGDEVDICVLPIYMPRYDDKTHFHWNYRIGYRGLGSSWANYCSPTGAWVTPYDFGLIDASMSSPNWDQVTSREHHEGIGKWLYEPTSDDPELCPGGDWSRYLCDGCERYVTPFCNDQGELICPTCEATGLVITQIDVLDHLEAVRENARQMGLSAQLERQLDFLATYGGHNYQCILGKDFAPFSFDFALYRPGVKDARKFVFNGGLIFQSPRQPADGSFPSLTVSLASGTGWFCHT
jgi:hypothetical protein